MKVLKGSGLGQGCGHRGEWLWPEGHWPKALEEELTVTGAQGKWEAVGVSVKRKKKKKKDILPILEIAPKCTSDFC